ncbi:right-handed parallel beta-helix repeat-containing protein [Fervidibacter sacchari]|uniref:Right handed beta helix domain-containing protein n=1 Tax=Candidatus Fervidibacter sacchari TaxID=1448929 RepID=A0ABT2EJ80_9BACT|nr:right-handed parallel beta-helix repeat-containing protein [Candidatus Fervidibacter sacchari]MCS3918001.1 hypothetical protein [Candidatus Fervidibacter sacchari]WKU15816.1 right-handed parallel beta-helix repeat-containing protein [Candidatus Fervidibacter sacchari]
MSDMRGIYMLGESQGTVVLGNVFHDIYCYSYGGWGLYADEDGNYGKENIIRNNIFVNSQKHQIQLTRAEEHLSFTFKNNIIHWTTKGPAIAGPWNRAKSDFSEQLLVERWGEPVTFFLGGGRSLAEWQKLGREEGSIITDPLFVDVARGDFRLKPNSPALKNRFQAV